MKKNLLRLFVVALFAIILFAPQPVFSGGGNASNAPAVKKAQPRRQMTQEEAEKDMIERDKRKLGPQVPKLMERIKVHMENGTLCPKDHEDMDIVYLGRARDPKAVQLLIEVLKNYHNPNARSDEARSSAASALGIIGDKSAIPALKEAMNDESDGVRGRASLTLLNLGEPDFARQFIKDQFKNGKYELYVMANLYNKTSIMDDELLNIVFEATKSNDEMTRLQAARVLTACGHSDKAFVVFKDIAKNSTKMKEYGLEGLSGINNNESVSIIIETLEDKDNYVRHSAIKALERLGVKGNKRAIASLQDLGKNGRNDDVKIRAQESLKRINQK